MKSLLARGRLGVLPVVLLIAACSQTPTQPAAGLPGPVPGTPQSNMPVKMPEPQVQRKADPRERAKIHTELGGAYFQLGIPAVALEELNIAIAADSSYYTAYSVRGLIFSSLKEFAKAEEDFQRAIGLAPNDPEINNNYGWFLCSTGKEAESIGYFMKALRDPLYETPGRAYTNAGACAQRMGDLDNAQGYLLKALQISKDGAVQARIELARLLYRRDNLKEARVYLNEALKAMEPPSPDALWLAIRLEKKLGNTRAEEGFAAQLRSRYPGSPEYQEFLKGNFQ